MSRQLVQSAALATICALVLALRVPVGFERARVRVVTSPLVPAANALRVPLPNLSSLDGPTAVVVRLFGGSAPSQIAVALDDEPIARLTLSAEVEQRIDLTVTAPRGPGHAVTISGDSSGWRLGYLEFANVHGFTRGLFAVDIVPAAQRHFQTLPWWFAGIVGVALCAIRPRREWPSSRRLRLVHRAACGLVLLFFVVVLFADRVTTFKILMAPHTFVWSVCILYAAIVIQVGETIADALVTAGRGFLRSSPKVSAAATRVAPALAAIAAVAMAITAWTLSARVAAGADSYGYVAQSALLARGELVIDQPVIADVPPGVSDAVMAPLGFTSQQQSPVRGRIVPVYSPGLPLVMAAFRLVGGPEAVYLVVPLLAGLTIWLTFVLGRNLLGPGLGLFAMIWLATSPSFLFSSLLPMSDVPVSAWWLAAFVAAMQPSALMAAVSGGATALAILTRPNLVFLAIFIALLYVVRWFRERTWRRAIEAATFALVSAIGPLCVAVLFQYLYGSPFVSGYGSNSALFSWAFLRPNLARYPVWFVDSQTPLILAFFAAPFLRWPSDMRAGMKPITLCWLMLGFAGVVWASYLVYMVFEEWWYLRFLLPSYPFLIALAAAALLQPLRRFERPDLVAFGVVAVIAYHGISFGADKDLFTISRGEARYKKVGEFVARELPERSLLLSMQHSGSLRYYGHRTTVRYDFLPHDRLDEVVAHFQARGWSVYIVVDEWEEDTEYRSRFSAANKLGKLDWTPIALWSVGMPVRIYDPRDRGATTPVVTRRIE